MFRYKYLLPVFGLFLAINSNASVIHFESDFDSAIDSGARITDGSYELRQGIGDVAIAGGELEFNLGGGRDYDQVNLDLGYGYDNYRVEFDLITRNLANSGHSFSVLFDTPTVQTLNFNNCCSNRIDTYTPFASNQIGSLGSLIDDYAMHVSIDIDLLLEEWEIDISGVGNARGGFYSSGGDVNSLRFSLATAMGGISGDPSVYAYMDNLVVSSITSVPEPASLGLFLSSFVLLLMARKTQKRRLL
ncbi:PEP-CTERM sorting domain-containing protein [Teredinibacter sp. KSP-S5-2]|uniref:PEP-CTERM sorting domain-containing protein n=1 Tax=Teredinibacter sp. KSP-S5-2 TaxID=3034506 RepID=UPI0029349AF0|nr:PEP-CTERM sorting domain-containing protein [Teredinibacter sp. KSP-S5-2]WNO11481.1 PEP-CTERM sorting domain-containing protein [Teredinibacter sp. KSP-S5-2]